MLRPDVLIEEARIQERVRVLAADIARDHAGQEPVLVPVLKGSFVFAADLARAIQIPVSIDFLGLRSYGGGTESSGVVQITSDLTHSIEDRHVIVVEDIVDTGLTMTYLLTNLATRRPRSIKLAALLHKPARTRVPVHIDYLGFSIEDVFVVGYGLDFAERYRNLPYLGVLPTPPHDEVFVSNRLELLEQMIKKGSQDPFHHYGVAMELKALGRLEESLKAFAATEERFPAYVPTYLIAAQVALALNRRDEAKGFLERGKHAAGVAGDLHAHSELAALYSAEFTG